MLMCIYKHLNLWKKKFVESTKDFATPLQYLCGPPRVTNGWWSIPSFPHAEVSLGKILNPKLPL